MGDHKKVILYFICQRSKVKEQTFNKRFGQKNSTNIAINFN